jgi:FkbM family methyltransferase
VLLKALPKNTKARLATRCTPIFRTYLRYAPRRIGSETLWKQVIFPQLWWRRELDFIARTAFGAKIAGNTKDVLQRYICYFGVWEPTLTHWIGTRLRPGDVFIDVGANIGYFSLLASRRVGQTGKVVALEASPEIFKHLNRNLALSKCTNVRALNLAVSDRKQSLELFEGPAENIGNTTTVSAWANRYHCRPRCQVKAMPLPGMLQPDEVKAARLIKIDVEGAEWSVVTGMTSMLSSCRADLEIIIEVNPPILREQGKSCEELLGSLERLGFHTYQIDQDCEDPRFPGESYVRRKLPRPPRRLREPLGDVEYAELILSRADAESLE